MPYFPLRFPNAVGFPFDYQQHCEEGVKQVRGFLDTLMPLVGRRPVVPDAGGRQFEDPIRHQRKTMDDMDCDLRSLFMQLAILRKVTQCVQQAQADLEGRRFETLHTTNTLLSQASNCHPFRTRPRLPAEVMAYIWKIYSRFPVTGKADYDGGLDCVLPQRHLNRRIIKEQLLLGDDAHRERPVAIELPYCGGDTLELRLLLLRQSPQTKLSISVSVEALFDEDDVEENLEELDQCLFLSSQWDELLIYDAEDTNSIRKILIRCGAAVPHIRYLWISDRGDRETKPGPFPIGIMTMNRLVYANFPHELYPAFQTLVSNIQALHIDIPTVESATAFRNNILRHLPRSLRHLFLSDPASLGHDEPPHTDMDIEETSTEQQNLPLLEVLAIQRINDLRALNILLPIFRGLKLRTLVILPIAELKVETKNADSVKKLLKTIDQAFPSLSTLVISACSAWALADDWQDLGLAVGLKSILNSFTAQFLTELTHFRGLSSLESLEISLSGTAQDKNILDLIQTRADVNTVKRLSKLVVEADGVDGASESLKELISSLTLVVPEVVVTRLHDDGCRWHARSLRMYGGGSCASTYD